MEINNASASVNQGISQIIEKLFPAWPVMVSTLIALLIVVVILHFFFRKPIQQVLANRQRAIQENIDSAKSLNKEAQLLLEKRNQEIKAAHVEAHKIIQEAKLQAQILGETFTKEAHKRAEIIKEEARREIKREKRLFEEQAQEYIIETSVILAKNILEREVSEKDNKKLLKQILKEEKKLEFKK